MVSVTISIYKPVKLLPVGADINDTGGDGRSDPVDQSQLELKLSALKIAEIRGPHYI